MKPTHGGGDGRRWTLHGRVSWSGGTPRSFELGLSPTGARVGPARLTENSAGRIVTGETGLAHAGAGRMSALSSRRHLFEAIVVCCRHGETDRAGGGWAGGAGDCSARRLARVGEMRGPAYPLSMTRAATSSARRKLNQQMLDDDAMRGGRWARAAEVGLRGRKAGNWAEQQRPDLPSILIVWKGAENEKRRIN